MERLFLMAQAADKRFPQRAEPFQMAARTLKECGEAAALECSREEGLIE